MISVFCLVQQLAMVEFESMRVLIARDTLEYLYMARVFDIVLKGPKFRHVFLEMLILAQIFLLEETS